MPSWQNGLHLQKPSRGCYNVRIERRLTLKIGGQKGKKEVKAEVNIGVKVGKDRFTRNKSFNETRRPRDTSGQWERCGQKHFNRNFVRGIWNRRNRETQKLDLLAPSLGSDASA